MQARVPFALEIALVVRSDHASIPDPPPHADWTSPICASFATNPERNLKMGKRVAINWKEALHLATRRSAVLLLSEGMGIFTVGSRFNVEQSRFTTLFIPPSALIVNITSGIDIGLLELYDTPAWIEEDMIEKWWCVSDPMDWPEYM
ncbi:hypothetical protein AX14_000439 [Amanita brunnescens Koide BX004]|nr:hypothetical protein AX14_000439 [Amanita brunnescens Koide BX004]